MPLEQRWALLRRGWRWIGAAWAFALLAWAGVAWWEPLAWGSVLPGGVCCSVGVWFAWKAGR